MAIEEATYKDNPRGIEPLQMGSLPHSPNKRLINFLVCAKIALSCEALASNERLYLASIPMESIKIRMFNLIWGRKVLLWDALERETTGSHSLMRNT